MAFDASIKIAGVFQTKYLLQNTLHISKYINHRTTANMTLFREDPSDTFKPVVGVFMDVYNETGLKIFGGTIDQVTENLEGMGPAIKFELTCVDFNAIMDKYYVSAVYENQLAGDIVRDLLVRNLPDQPQDSGHNLAAEAIVAVDIQDGANVDIIIFDYPTVGEAFDKLAELSVGFVWWVDAELGFHFVSRTAVVDATYFNPNTATFQPYTLTDTNDQFIAESFRRTITREKFADILFLRYNRKALSPETFTYVGDGISQTFPRPNSTDVLMPAMAVAPIVTLNGIDQSVGLLPEVDNPGLQWYWRQGGTTIVQATLDPPIADTDTLEVSVYALFKNIFRELDQSVIDDRAAIENGQGIYEYLIDESDMVDPETVAQTAKAVLDKLKVLGEKIEFQTTSVGLEPGTLVPVTLAGHGLTGQKYLIDRVEFESVQKAYWAYRITAFGGQYLGSYLEFFEALAGKRGSDITGISTPLKTEPLGWSICLPSTVTFPHDADYLNFFKAGKGLAIRAVAIATPPVVGPLTIDILDRAGVSIFSTNKLVIPNATTDIAIQDVFRSGFLVNQYDWFRPRVLSGQGSNKITLYLIVAVTSGT